jgi:hypothetical protein
VLIFSAGRSVTSPEAMMMVERALLSARPDLPPLGSGSRAEYVKDRPTLQWVAPDFVARPARGESGTAGKVVFRNPGIHNWDMALFKNIPLGRGAGGPQLQFRWEAYNVFNHTQYAPVDTTARFNPAGQQVNTTFGRVTATRPPRQMQMSLRVQF